MSHRLESTFECTSYRLVPAYPSVLGQSTEHGSVSQSVSQSKKLNVMGSTRSKVSQYIVLHKDIFHVVVLFIRF